jgi:hypothetical protein
MFENNIKQWVSIDDKLKAINEEMKELKSERNTLEQDIITYVKSNDIKNATINISDGKIRFVETKQTSPLTLKYIENCLTSCIGNEEHVNQIMSIIKNKREIKYTSDIKRYTK